MSRRSFAQVAPPPLVVAIVLLLSSSGSAFAQASAPTGNASAPAGNASPAANASQQATPADEPEGFLSEPGFITSIINLANQFGEQDSGTPKAGFYPEMSNMLTGSGWLAIGPGYRNYFANDRGLFEASAAVSWHLYTMGQARVEARDLADGHLRLGTQVIWQDNTQVNFFGIGPDVVDADQSQYQIQTHDFVGYATVTSKEWLTWGGRFGWLGHPKVMNPGGTFKPNVPSTLVAFPNDPAVSLSEQPALLHSEAAIAADTRNHRGHPTRGFLYRGALTNYWDRTYGTFTFHTWEAEGLQYVPLAGARVVLAFHAWTVQSNPGPEHEIPFYLLPSIGGNRVLRSYHTFEFHDNNLLSLQAESRFALFTHVDLALLADAGNVAPNFGGLNLDKTGYGAGVRLHTEKTTLARLDVAKGSQGWHVVFSTTEPFRLPRTRTRRENALIPFAP